MASGFPVMSDWQSRGSCPDSCILGLREGVLSSISDICHRLGQGLEARAPALLTCSVASNESPSLPFWGSPVSGSEGLDVAEGPLSPATQDCTF